MKNTDLTEKALKQRKNMSNPSGHWTNNENYNMRQFVDNYAKKYNFDPLDPLNWYSISRLQFVKEPVCINIYFQIINIIIIIIH